MMVPVTKMGTPVEKLNLRCTAGFRRQVCEQSSAISVAHTQRDVSQQKPVIWPLPVTDIQLFLNEALCTEAQTLGIWHNLIPVTDLRHFQGLQTGGITC